MRRLFIAITWIALLSASSSVAAQTKMDPFLDLLAPAASPAIKAQIAGKSLESAQEDTERRIDLFIKANDVALAKQSLQALGGDVRLTLRNLLTASVPASALPAIESDENVLFVEAAKPVHLSNDVANAEIGVSEVHQGLNLPSPYTGTGIIVGIIDTGIDYRNDDFKDGDGKNRIIAIWDQTDQGGRRPTEIEDSYGSECDTDAILTERCSLTDVDGHGTHVAGIAAGRHEKYGGVAPDAKIVVVKYDSSLDLDSGYAETLFSTKICEAAYYVFAKAKALGMPAVVNLSLGTHLGAHDGTSLFEQCLDGLVEGSSGRALVAAAGNEYSSDSTFTGIHTGFEVNGTQATNFVIREITRDRVYYIDLWGARGSSLSVGLAMHNGTPQGKPIGVSELVPLGETAQGSFNDGLVKYMINASESASPLNGKPHVGIRIVLTPGVKEPDLNSFDLIVSGQGAVDAWLFPDKPSKAIQFTSVSGSRGAAWTYVPGDRSKSVAIPSTAANVLSVTGYASRNRWTINSLSWTFNGNDLGELLSFASAGPSADPEITGQKPEIAAPGGMIASTLSSAALPDPQLVMEDGKHFLQAGTSMAAPYVTGAIALMFQANPDYTPSDIEKYLTMSAYIDASVESAPNNYWGYGKLDVLRAVEYAVTGEATGAFNEETSLSAPQNTEQKGGCELIGSVRRPLTKADIPPFLILLAAALILACRRRTDRCRERIGQRKEDRAPRSGHPAVSCSCSVPCPTCCCQIS